MGGADFDRLWIVAKIYSQLPSSRRGDKFFSRIKARLCGPIAIQFRLYVSATDSY